MAQNQTLFVENISTSKNHLNSNISSIQVVKTIISNTIMINSQDADYEIKTNDDCFNHSFTIDSNANILQITKYNEFTPLINHTLLKQISFYHFIHHEDKDLLSNALNQKKWGGNIRNLQVRITFDHKFYFTFNLSLTLEEECEDYKQEFIMRIHPSSYYPAAIDNKPLISYQDIFTIFNGFKMPLVIIDQFGIVVDANQNMQTILGRSSQDLNGKNWFKFAPPAKEAKQMKQCFFKKEESFKLETFSLVNSQGALQAFSWITKSFISSEHEAPLYLCIGQPIQKNPESNNHLNHQTSHLIMAGGYAIDFNNIFCRMYIYIDLLQDFIKNSAVAMDYHCKILKGLTEGIYSSQQLIELSKVIEPKIREEDPRSIIQECIEEISTENQIYFDVHIPDDIHRIQCDKKQISFAISQILKNSCESIQEKGIISISANIKSFPEPLFPERDPINYLNFKFVDNGSGMDTHVLERVFDPYYSTKTSHGIGLSVARNIVRNHRGMLEVYSEPAKGTTVLVSLPVTQEMNYMA